MTLRWFGTSMPFTNVTAEDISAGANTTMSIGFASPLFHAGDTLERIICYYWFQTHYVDNTLLANPPWAVLVAAWWQPNPQADAPIPDPTSEDVVDAIHGDALYVDYGRWRSDRFTDGAVNSTQWICDSLTPQSLEGRRTIQDVDTAQLKMGWTLGAISPFNVLDIAVDGFIAIRYLMNIKQAP